MSDIQPRSTTIREYRHFKSLQSQLDNQSGLLVSLYRKQKKRCHLKCSDGESHLWIPFTNVKVQYCLARDSCAEEKANSKHSYPKKVASSVTLCSCEHTDLSTAIKELCLVHIFPYQHNFWIVGITLMPSSQFHISSKPKDIKKKLWAFFCRRMTSFVCHAEKRQRQCCHTVNSYRWHTHL